MSTVMASSTLRFLQTAGVRPGANCLDVGCRDGQVAIEMARAVGPERHHGGDPTIGPRLPAHPRADFQARVHQVSGRRPT
jgi:hypothetical protein